MAKSTKQAFEDGIIWIAENDEPTLMTVKGMEGLISVQMLANIFDRSAKEVAYLVVRLRQEIRAAA